MASIPPGFTQCPTNPEHVYPSYYRECDICAQKRNESQYSSQVQFAQDDGLDGRRDKMTAATIVFFVAAVIAIGYFAVQAPKTEAAKAAAPAPVAPVARKIGAGGPASLGPGQTASVPLNNNHEQIETAGHPTTPLTKTIVGDVPVVKVDASDLTGHWRQEQVENGVKNASFSVAYVGGQLSVSRTDIGENGVIDNVSSAFYDGTNWLLHANWGTLGKTNISLKKDGPGVFSGGIISNGKQIGAVRWVKED